MRFSKLSKFGFVGLAGGALLVLSLKLQAQQSQGPAISIIDDVTPSASGSTNSRTSKSRSLRMSGADQGAAKINQSCQLLNGSLRVEGSMVFVAVQAKLKSVLSDSSYVWRLRVTKEGHPDPVSDILFQDQTFRMEPDGEMTPGFLESFELPTGDYAVSVILHEVTGDSNLSVLSQPENWKKHVLIRKVMRCHVQ